MSLSTLRDTSGPMNKYVVSTKKRKISFYFGPNPDVKKLRVDIGKANDTVTLTCNISQLKLSQYFRGKIQVRVARFQRPHKWKKKDREFCYKSLKENISLGTIILWQPRIGSSYFVIIDGQQRMATLKHIFDNPTQYMLLREPIKDTLTRYGMFEIVQDWLQTVRDKNIYELDNILEDTSEDSLLIQHINQYANYEHEETRELHKKLYAKVQNVLRNEIDIGAKTITQEVYIGEDARSFMPIVYERVNRAGVKLNKWELFASACMDKQYEILGELSRGLIDYMDNRPFASCDNNTANDEAIETFTLWEFIWRNHFPSSTSTLFYVTPLRRNGLRRGPLKKHLTSLGTHIPVCALTNGHNYFVFCSKKSHTWN